MTEICGVKRSSVNLMIAQSSFYFIYQTNPATLDLERLIRWGRALDGNTDVTFLVISSKLVYARDSYLAVRKFIDSPRGESRQMK